MRFDGGWIKLHRSIFTSDIQGDGSAILIFMLLISWANVKDGRYKGKPIFRGQLVTGTRQIAEALKISVGTVHRKIIMLEKYGMLERKKTQWGSLITICNYCKFQDQENEVGTQKDSMVERRWNAGGTQVEREWNHNEELNNIRTKEVKNITLSCPESSPQDHALPQKKTKPKKAIDPEILPIASDWLKFALEEQPWRRESAAFNVEAFAEALAKVARATSLNPTGLRSVLDFIENDEFWRKVAISPNGLLTMGKNGSRKIDNILIKMKPADDLAKKTLQKYVDNAEEVVNPFLKWK